MLNIHDPRKTESTPPLLRLGFRPFFLFGATLSILGVVLWVLALSGVIAFQPHGGAYWWHGHEMLFGFATAIIAGFLLTAVQNWTGVPGLSGNKLLALVLLWLAPRLTLPITALPLELVMALDLAFLPAVAIALGHSVAKVRQWRNLVFVPMMLLMACLNALSYLALTEGNPLLAQKALQGAALVVIMIVALLGGRVIPFFTERASSYQRKANLWYLDAGTFVSLLMLIAALVLDLTALQRPTAAVAAIIILIRWHRWGWRHTFSVPLLWSLHLSYLCIPVGLGIIALGLPFSAGFHALAAGGMGGMILAMMARVSLGHTGRLLEPPKAMVIGFVMVLLAVVLRVMAGLLPMAYLPLLVASALAWGLAFGIFIVKYGPMLTAPRADGRPG
ncbi:NnrS family protein [Shewanella litorisediminis]|uniref:NnrS family protein n=1 Tax=Shewanella litorisediminis TaxID=1173586 RepID=A0ABX7G6W6_9GAMM|nr:NnrS family protein [Shewanella litorisediminis]MCL2916809.1 NnrS family protein [Shewanella litorisediminis]QRH03024.1 NnrS family protein [Shewanella litorisediminis]